MPTTSEGVSGLLGALRTLPAVPLSPDALPNTSLLALISLPMHPVEERSLSLA